MYKKHLLVRLSSVQKLVMSPIGFYDILPTKKRRKKLLYMLSEMLCTCAKTD